MSVPELPVAEPPAKRILEAAKALFATRGYEQTTTAMIARQAGTCESEIVKHFESKEVCWQPFSIMVGRALRNSSRDYARSNPVSNASRLWFWF